MEIAAHVIKQSSREHPADAVLRGELKNARLSRAEAADVSRAVFHFFRWRGWLDSTEPHVENLKAALELAESFSCNPLSFSDEEIKACSIPEWAGQQMTVSSEWAWTLQAEPRLWLRAKRGGREELAAALGDCVSSTHLSDALEYRGKQDLFRTEAFSKGEFEIQDIASQAVGLVCHPRPGEAWWDACAGEGGKTLHLSDLMANKGLLWASDRAEWRLKKLKQRAGRAGAFNYRAALWDGSARLPTKTQFDGVLLDAPCSGVGTWQRNPHARWTTTLEDVAELAAVQKQLLANAVAAVKPGGRLIYAVCTLTRAETDEVAQAFDKQFPEFVSQKLPHPFAPEQPPFERLWLWPQETGGNGMFIAAWQRQPLKK